MTLGKNRVIGCAAALLVLVAGCGTNAPQRPLSRTQFASKADAICARNTEPLIYAIAKLKGDLGAGRLTGPEKAYLTSYAAALGKSATEISKLVPPHALVPAIRSNLAGMRHLQKLALSLRESVGLNLEMAQGTDPLSRAAGRLEVRWSDLGVGTACAQTC